MNEPKKIPFDILDSIRGIAALYVTIAHCRGVLWVGGERFMQMFHRSEWGTWDYFVIGTSMLTRLAVEFVIVFFVLSGFSIAHSLSSNKSPLSFYKRRFIRLYPPYVMALIFAGIVFLVTRYWFPHWYDGSQTQYAYIRTMEMNSYFDRDVILKNLFYMPTTGFITPFWSLTYEVIFYLLAPFLLRKVNVYTMISLILFLFNFIFPDLVISLRIPIHLHNFIFVYNIYFAIGVYLYNNYEKVSRWFANYTKIEFLVIMGGILAIMFGANFYLKLETDFTFIEASLLSVVLIIFFITYKVRIPWLMKVGEFSYTLYITHFASIYLYLGIYWMIFKPDSPVIINFFVWIPAVFFCLAIAWLLYLLVEKQTKSMLNRLRRKPKDPVVAQVKPGKV